MKNTCIIFLFLLSYGLLGQADSLVKGNYSSKQKKAVIKPSAAALAKKDQEVFKKIPLVKIAGRTWISQNLDVTTFRNGDLIPEAKTEQEWKAICAAGKPAWCYYNNDPASGEKYGKLYNWYAVNDPRGLAPRGWHIPVDSEWNSLSDSLGGNGQAGGRLKSEREWAEGKGKKQVGFEALPGGFRLFDGAFYNIGSSGSWWSATVCPGEDARYWGVNASSVFVNTSAEKKCAMAVRCIKD